MADKTDDLVLSISADVAALRRSLKKVEAAVAASSNQVRKQFDDAGKGIDKSITTAMQSRIDTMVGIGTKAAKEWNGVLSSQGAELEKLRAKYNPVFAAVKQYQASVVSIQQAHRLGAISSDEMTSAIQRERKATLESIAALKQRNTALSDTPQMSGPRGFQTANIAAQFQDIAVTSAMGMSPIQIALQQGTQLSGVFNEMGKGKAVIQGIGAAFASIVSPVSLVTIGVIAAGAALAQYIASAGDVETADELLKQHEEHIKRLGPAYEEALKKQKKYVTESPAVVNIGLADDQEKAIARRLKEAQAAMRDVFAATMSSEDSTQVASTFKPAEQAMNSFFESVRAKTPQVAKFREEIGRLAASGQLTNEAAASLLKFTNSAYDAEIKLGEVKGKADEYGVALQNFAGSLQGISSTKAREELQQLFDKAMEGDARFGDLIEAIKRLSLTVPDLSAQRDELIKTAEAAMTARAAVEGFANTTPKSDRNPGLSDANFNTRFDNPRDKLAEDLKRQREELERKPRKTGGERQAERDANAYRDLVKSAQDRIDQMRLEEQLVGKTGVAAEAMRMKLELLQNAQDKGRTVSESQRKEIEALAQAYGAAAEKVAAMTMAEELRFEREQLFRSPTEQRVHSELRSSGIAPDSAQGQFLAGQIRLNEKLAEARDLSLDFAQGFTQDLLNGVSAMDALANAAGRLGDKLIDMALNQAINSLFGNLMGSLGGGASDPWAGMRIPGFAAGTNSAPGGLAMVGEKGPELVNLPRGSQVIPNDILRSMTAKPIDAPRVPSMPSVANSNSARNVHVTVGVDVDKSGNLMPFVVSVSDQRASAAVTKNNDTALPTLVNKYAGRRQR